MPNNFQELHKLLESTTPAHRQNVRELIDAPFGSSPKSLCDQACFLRSGALGQVFDKRDYKQLVTDIADHYEMNWEPLIARKNWHQLTSQEIEVAIMEHIDGAIPEEDRENHIPFSEYLKQFLLGAIAGKLPLAASYSGILKTALDAVFNLQSTDWKRLLALVTYVNTAIRPDLRN